jgi:putative ABC transport system permease protein
MSVPQTVLVGAVAIVAGVLASILPGRRAARSAPIEALAEAGASLSYGSAADDP